MVLRILLPETFIKARIKPSTVPINMASIPAISLPCGVTSEGMPVGMQLIGPKFSEETLLNAAYTFEQKIKFRENHKPEFKK